MTQREEDEAMYFAWSFELEGPLGTAVAQSLGSRDSVLRTAVSVTSTLLHTRPD
jgi:hypothetical protein